MKNVILAPSAGFCFGVQRAVDMVDQEIARGKGPIYTYGPIIHNEIVVRDFEKRGVAVIEEGHDLSEYEPGIVILRSHGITAKVYHDLEDHGFTLVDATCPNVLRIHRLVEKYAREGYHILIIGNARHPEVEGIIGWIPEGSPYTAIMTEKEAESFTLSENDKLLVVSQTTFNYKKFGQLVEILEQKGYDITAVNTICNATEERQRDAYEIARKTDVMLVIGGKNSSNTQKLYEICSRECKQTYFIQTIDDLDVSVLQSIQNVGITAGASTPQKIIKEVQTNVRNEF